jgi:hypothetical protein
MCGHHDDDELSLANGSLPHKRRKSPEEEDLEKSPEENPSI